MTKVMSLIIREMQTKITMRYHVMPIKMVIKKKKMKNIDKNVGKLEPLYAVSRNAKWYSCYGKQYEGSSKNKN